MTHAIARRADAAGAVNRLSLADQPVHAWYRFVLAFPPHLVRHYLDRFGVEPGQRVLDPFCGTGTVVVECKRRGIASLGVEANPMAHFATRVKGDWTPDPRLLAIRAEQVAAQAQRMLVASEADNAPGMAGAPTGGTRRALPPQEAALLLDGSISPLPLHKALVLRDAIRSARADGFTAHALLTFARTLVQCAGNLHFGPEVGVGPPRQDAPVIAHWLAGMHRMAADLELVRHQAATSATALYGDARCLAQTIEPGSVDAVITSPPYPNEKDYTRATRLESVLLGFIRTKAELRTLKRGLVRSNTRGVYRTDDDDRWVAEHPEIQRIAAAIEARRIALGKTSGFERLYARVTRLYFGGMARHLAELRTVLRPGARLAYVVGDQASYLRVLIRTGELLADIACSLGYEVEHIDLFRTRLATLTREQLREEVVVLRWPGATRRA